MGEDTMQDQENPVPSILASCTGEGCEALIIRWVREHGLTRKEVKILTNGDTVWVSEVTSKE